MAEKSNNKADALGHRQRLRNRLLKGGGDAIADYELLELVLFAAKPRGDTKPLAKQLIKEFGSFADAVAADKTALSRVAGMGEASVAAIKSIEAAALRLTQSRIMDRPALSSWDAVLAYLQALLGRSKIEEFHVLFLDKKNALISDEALQRGTVDHTAVYPREIVKRALELGASAIILVHNHPSGDPTPSQQDIEMTKRIQSALRPMNITLHDHIIIGRGKHTSFRSHELL